jgi:tetratricopeptide (TPR) repeat protein
MGGDRIPEPAAVECRTLREPHPDPSILTRFVLGELPGVESAEIERHLAVCSGCRDRADEAMGLESLPLLAGVGSGYDEAFDRALSGVAEKLAGLSREARSAGDLLAEILREPAPGRQRRIRDDERFHSLKLCQLLREHSRERWLSEPGAAPESAELAVGVSEHLDPARYGAALTADARALAWAYLGNALRITSDFRRGERALGQAWSHHRRGSGDLETEGELLGFTASLKFRQGRFAEALRTVDQAIAVACSLGDDHREGALGLKKGIFLTESGRPGEAILAIRRGLLQIDAAKDPRLLLIGKLDLASLFVECGEHREAGRLLGDLRALHGRYRGYEDGVVLARIGWAEGEFARNLGHFTEAERHLSATREFFLHQELGVDVVLISLDLAEMHARAGQPRRVRELLEDVIPLGEAIGLGRQVVAARLLYAQACGR